jgi:hypothetical protein
MPLVYRPGLPLAYAFLAYGPYVREGDDTVLLEVLAEPLFLVIEFDPPHEGPAIFNKVIECRFGRFFT